MGLRFPPCRSPMSRSDPGSALANRRVVAHGAQVDGIATTTTGTAECSMM